MLTPKDERLEETVTQLESVEEKIFEGICLSFAPFARAALLREQMVSCFSNRQQLD